MIPMHSHLISQLIADRQAGLMASARQQRLARQARAARRARPAQRGRAAPMLAALGCLPWRRPSPCTIQTPAAGPGQAAPTLTPRELGLLKLTAQGLTNPDIAQQLVLPRRGRDLRRTHRARLRTPNGHAISAGHRACRPPWPGLPPGWRPTSERTAHTHLGRSVARTGR